MKRPSFQFYPGDWQANSNLRRCSHAEKGVWIDVMCLLHDQEEYGVLRWPLKEIAQAVGCSVGVLKGIIAKGVFKGDDKHLMDVFVYVPRSGRKDGDPVTLVPTQAGPIWYSSRMVKDEYVRTVRGESTRFGGDNGGEYDSPKHSPKPPFGDGSSSPSSSSASQIPSVAKATDADGGAPAKKDKPPKTPEEMAKAELWRAAVSVLEQGGCPPSQCRTFMGKLVSDYTFPVVKDAVAAAVNEQPADAREYLKATCQHAVGQRQRPNKQEELEASNRAVVEQFLAMEPAHAD